MKGVILKADKFGNLITNFSVRDIPKMFEATAPQFKILVGGKEVTIRRDAYAQGMHNEVFAIVGSMGYLEIAANRGSAKALCAADRGTEVGIMIDGVTYNIAAPNAAPA